jgi:hypothetical protein
MLLTGIAFFGSVLWFVAQPDYETAIAFVTSLTAFIGSIIAKRSRPPHSAQHQKIGKRGIGVQAGRDVTIGPVQSDESTKCDAK